MDEDRDIQVYEIAPGRREHNRSVAIQIQIGSNLTTTTALTPAEAGDLLRKLTAHLNPNRHG